MGYVPPPPPIRQRRDLAYLEQIREAREERQREHRRRRAGLVFFWSLLVSLALWVVALSAGAQILPGSGHPECTAAALQAGTCAAATGGNVAFVTDSLAGADCSTGGGSFRVMCSYDSSDPNWVLVEASPGTPGADSVGTTELADGADVPSTGECVRVASDPNDIEYLSCLSGLTSPADWIDDPLEIDATVKTSDDPNARLLMTTEALPAGNRCLELDPNGLVMLAGSACATPSGITDGTAAGDVTLWDGDSWEPVSGGLDLDFDATLEIAYYDPNDTLALRPTDATGRGLLLDPNRGGLLSPAPQLELVDTSMADASSERSALWTTNCADIGSGVEDCDSTHQHQIDGTLTSYLVASDAPGAPTVTLGSASHTKVSLVTIGSGIDALDVPANSLGADDIAFAQIVGGGDDASAEFRYDDTLNLIYLCPEDTSGLGSCLKFTTVGLEAPSETLDGDLDGTSEVTFTAGDTFSIDGNDDGDSDLVWDSSTTDGPSVIWDLDDDPNDFAELAFDPNYVDTWDAAPGDPVWWLGTQANDEVPDLVLRDDALEVHNDNGAGWAGLFLYDRGLTSGSAQGWAGAVEARCQIKAASNEACWTRFRLYDQGAEYVWLDIFGGTEKITIGDPALTGGVVFDTNSVEIPNGAGADVAAAGEIGVDPNDATHGRGQFLFYSGGAARRLDDVQTWTMTYDRDFSGAQDAYAFKARADLTVLAIHCIVHGDGGGPDHIDVTVEECSSTGASCAETEDAINCSIDGDADDGTLTDAAIDSGDWINISTAAETGNVVDLTVQIEFAYNRE